MLSEDQRKLIEAALENLPAPAAERLRDRLETPERPESGYRDGQAGYVLTTTLSITRGSGVLTLIKAAYLADAPDVWRYGLFAPEEMPRPTAGTSLL